ncbi:hypothetical protein ACET3Z_032313 [Daucus carota]
MTLVPNPLFDLAGIMCGQFGIPFWQFFLATSVGKAIIKTHLQVCEGLFFTKVYAQLEFDASYVYEDVNRSIQYVHRSGLVHIGILSDPQRYLVKNCLM